MCHLTHERRFLQVARKQRERPTKPLCRRAFINDITANHVSFGVRQLFTDRCSLYVMLSHKVDLEKLEEPEKVVGPAYTSRYCTLPVPKYELSETGMRPDCAYQLVHDEMNLDGNPSLNLASFVTTWMEPQATQLIVENIHKNFADQFEYPQTEVIHRRCVNMLARLFNAPDPVTFAGTATGGSSEAVMLGLLAHKWKWKKRREAEGAVCDKPNLIFGADAHICWDKFAKYFDVEPRVIPLEEDRFTITREAVTDLIDENTICVGVILGTTFTGEIDPIEEINDLLVEVKNTHGWDIPIHVDAAIGGFILPFTQPELRWDFRLSQVKSINVSAHKYGLVYPGLGWLIFRDTTDLPADLVFYVNYLGDEMASYTLNFSRGSSMLLAQYYNLLRLGWKGYAMAAGAVLENAQYLTKRLLDTGYFYILNAGEILPVVTFQLKEPVDFSVYDLCAKLRERGWIVPAYTLPPNADAIPIMRVVVRQTFSRDMADLFVDDIKKAYAALLAPKTKTIVKQRSPREAHPVS